MRASDGDGDVFLVILFLLIAVAVLYLQGDDFVAWLRHIGGM